MADILKPNSRILDLGCGNNKQPGAYGVDLFGDQADFRVNLETFPWPFPTSYFFVAYALQVLEHLSDRVRVMQELWRISKPGALVFVTVPNGLCPGFVQDPTHKQPWSIGTFMYFCPDQFIPGSERPPYEFGAQFHILHYDVCEKAGKTPWGSPVYADNLTVVLQVVKHD